MKKLLTLLMLFSVIAFVSCSKDDDKNAVANFKYGEALLGTWKVVKVGSISWPYEITTATFNLDGTYSGKGYFGNGTGTYTAEGIDVKCYIEGKLFVSYEVESLDGNKAVMKMYSTEGSSITLTCEKY